MAKKKKTFYEILVYVAYGFYILLGLSWFVVSFLNGSGFNPTAFFILGAFSVQAYYQHRLTNLILGFLALFFSIYVLMGEISTFNLMGKDAVYDAFVKVTIGMLLFSMVLSVVLVFSYLKMSFKEQE